MDIRHGMMALAGMTAFAAAVPAVASAPVRSAQPGIDAAQADAAAREALLRLVNDFIAAQRAFDAAALRALTTSDYLEISPVGEVDAREKMLGFYAPDKKHAAPAVAIQEPVVRVWGNAAIVVVKLAYTIQVPEQPARVMEMRASYMAQRVNGRWLLASAQYTGIRPTPKTN